MSLRSRRPLICLSQDLTFGFEQTFTIPHWWQEPGFVATSDTPLKREKMRDLARALVRVQGGSFRKSLDLYQHLQYETFLPDGVPSFVVTMDPGSIEVKTPPVRCVEVEPLMQPLFVAAEQAGLVPYRNWWYGVQGGTEGGCHVNMGGANGETNPWVRDPVLLLQYAGFLHNHPEVHYPFMGLDTGPGGNAVRMDENEEADHASIRRWREARQRVLEGQGFSAEEFSAFFRGTRILEDRHSAPSFYKFRAPLYLVEDRAQESFRSAEDARLVCELRLRILERLQAQHSIDDLVPFGPELHAELLTLPFLWERFERLAESLDLPAVAYARFFERQFPRLTGGAVPPVVLQVREGRRPRVITDVKKRGDLVISKSIDTRYKRLEVHWPEEYGERVRIDGVERTGRPFLWAGARLRCAFIDLFVENATQGLELEIPGVERALFRPADMLFA